MVPMRSTKVRALMALIIAAFIGGAVTPGLVRIGSSALGPFTFNFFRTAVTLLCLLPVLLNKRQLWQKAAFHKVVLIAGLGVGFNTTFFALGIPKTTIVASQLLYGLLPLTASLAAFLLIGEKVSRLKAIAIGLGLIGMSFLLLFSRSETQRLALGTLEGNTLILIAVMSHTLYVVLSKNFSQEFSALELTLATYLGLFAFSFLLALIPLTRGFSLDVVSPSVIGSVLISGISSIFFMLLFQYGIQKLSTSTTAITVLLAPQFGALSGALFFQETITPALVASMILVSLAISLSFLGERLSFLRYANQGLKSIPQKLGWSKL